MFDSEGFSRWFWFFVCGESGSRARDVLICRQNIFISFRGLCGDTGIQFGSERNFVFGDVFGSVPAKKVKINS